LQARPRISYSVENRRRNMLKKVAENIYQTQIPLPENPLRYINVYIIKGEDKIILK
jgi:hypothetical protein